MRLSVPIGGLLLALLAGCEVSDISTPIGQGGLSGQKWDISEVEALPLVDDAYLSGLQDGYIKLAKAEFAEFDWADGAEFAARAKLAADGQRSPPFDASARVSGGPEVEPLIAAGEELVGFLASKGAMLRAGRQIGDAQVAYDCWVQEAQEGHQSADIDACRSNYEELMILVRALGALPENMAVVLPQMDGAIGGIEIGRGEQTVALDTPFAAAGTGERFGDVPVEEGEIRDAFAGALAAQPKPPVEFTLIFQPNSTAISVEAYDLIAQAAEEALSRAAAEVIVTGHADAVGTSGANLAISRQRAQRVRREVLRELGARESAKSKISVASRARGERDLAVETSTPRAENRRVVILVR